MGHHALGHHKQAQLQSPRTCTPPNPAPPCMPARHGSESSFPPPRLSLRDDRLGARTTRERRAGGGQVGWEAGTVTTGVGGCRSRSKKKWKPRQSNRNRKKKRKRAPTMYRQRPSGFRLDRSCRVTSLYCSPATDLRQDMIEPHHARGERGGERKEAPSIARPKTA